jgi:copper oxidase (laccase) domain-containing protein
MPPDGLVGWPVEWPAPAGVRAFMSTRHGGVSQGTYGSLNLGLHVGDDQ